MKQRDRDVALTVIPLYGRGCENAHAEPFGERDGSNIVGGRDAPDAIERHRRATLVEQSCGGFRRVSLAPNCGLLRAPQASEHSRRFDVRMRGDSPLLQL